MNPNAIPLLNENFDKIDWDQLSMNPNAFSLLEKDENFDKIKWNKIDWAQLSFNPEAIPLLQKFHKINWKYLSGNPNAIFLLEKEILEKNHKIDWYYLSINPNSWKLIDFLEAAAYPKKSDYTNSIGSNSNRSSKESSKESSKGSSKGSSKESSKKSDEIIPVNYSEITASNNKKTVFNTVSRYAKKVIDKFTRKKKVFPDNFLNFTRKNTKVAPYDDDDDFTNINANVPRKNIYK